MREKMNIQIQNTIKSLVANGQEKTFEEYIELCNEKLKLNYDTDKEIDSFKPKIKEEFEKEGKLKAGQIIEKCINEQKIKNNIVPYKDFLEICKQKLEINSDKELKK